MRRIGLYIFLRIILVIIFGGFSAGCTGDMKAQEKSNQESLNGQREYSVDLLQVSGAQSITGVENAEVGTWTRLPSGARIYLSGEGVVRFRPGNLWENLAPGESFNQNINYQFVDANGQSGQAQITITVTKDNLDDGTFEIVEPTPQPVDNQTPDSTNDTGDDTTQPETVVEDTTPDTPAEEPNNDSGDEVVINPPLEETPVEESPTESPDTNTGEGTDSMTGNDSGMDHSDHMASDDGMSDSGSTDDGSMDSGMDHSDHMGMDHSDHMGMGDGTYHHYPITVGTSESHDTFTIRPPAPERPADHHGSRHACVVTHLSYDDPVVYPGQPGAAHLHMFYGNTSTDHNTTSANIRQRGNSSCRGGTVNLSAYWSPALYDANMQVRIPHSIFIYYKNFTIERSQLRPIPVGMQMLASQAVLNAHQFHFGPHPIDFDDGSPSVVGLGLTIDFPNCAAVDAQGNPILSSPGGTSHLAYAAYNGCPASHPYSMPSMSINLVYNLDPNSRWQLASDSSPDTQGATLHADYIAGWTDTAMQTITQCNRDLNEECSPEYGPGDFVDRYFTPEGLRMYRYEAGLMPGFDDTPLDLMLPKTLGGSHSH